MTHFAQVGASARKALMVEMSSSGMVRDLSKEKVLRRRQREGVRPARLGGASGNKPWRID